MNLPQVERSDWDVVVVGAGPSGSLAARGLAQRGLAVLLVDRSVFPRWKVCGSCLHPATLAILSRAGLADLPRRWGAVSLARMQLGVQGRAATLPLPGWLVLSRERFDHSLTLAAESAGATFLPATQASLGPALPGGRVVRLRQGSREVCLRSSLVLAADGLGGGLLRGEGVELATAPDARVGAGVIVEGPAFYAAGTVWMAYGRGGYVGIVRLEDGRLNLAAALDREAVRAAGQPGRVAVELLREVGWPEVPGLAEAGWRGTPAMTRQVARAGAERVLALGDAAGYVEPFTGEGMGWALWSGWAVVHLATEAVRDWHPGLIARWTVLHRRNARRRQRLAWGMTWLSRYPAVARRLVGLVGRFPWLARPLIGRA